eukprot:2330655-Prorocentrum_lima.AAC.1
MLQKEGQSRGTLSHMGIQPNLAIDRETGRTKELSPAVGNPVDVEVVSSSDETKKADDDEQMQR